MNRACVLILGWAVIGAGCASAEGPATGADDLTAGCTGSAGVATIASDQLSGRRPGCKVTLDVARIEVPGNAAATAAIAGALPKSDVDALCAGAAPDEDRTVEGFFSVVTNKQGVLSMTVSQTEMSRFSAHPSVSIQNFTFDLATGQRRKLLEVLNGRGLQATRAFCTNELANLLGGDRPQAEMFCTEGTQASAVDFLVTNEGIAIELHLPHVLLAIGETLIPWARLETGLEPGPIADFAKNH